MRAPAELKLPPDQEVRLYKNNTDFVGHSYGCHDNYLMRRDVPWDRIVARRAAVPDHAANFCRRRQDGHRSGEHGEPAGHLIKFRSGRIFSACS